MKWSEYTLRVAEVEPAKWSETTRTIKDMRPMETFTRCETRTIYVACLALTGVCMGWRLLTTGNPFCGET